MLFDSIVKNKVTEFSCRHGDEVCKLTFEYDIEGIEELIKSFKMISTFLGFSENDILEYIKETYMEECENDMYEEEDDSVYPPSTPRDSAASSESSSDDTSMDLPFIGY